MKKNLHYLLLSLLFTVFAQAQEFNIEQAVTVIISQKGFNNIKDEIIPLLTSNGVDLSHFSSEDISLKTEVKPTEKFAKAPAMQKTIKEMKELMSKYISGLTINDHEFQIGVKKILLNAKWSKIEFNVHPLTDHIINENSPSADLFDADLIMVASNIKIKVDSLRVKDLQNAWLGEWGLNNIVIDGKSKSVPLSIKVPLRFYRKDNELLGIEVKTVETNLEKMKLTFDYAKPLIIPKIQIKINDTTFSLNQSALETDLANQQEAILKSIQEAIDENAKDAIPAMLNAYAEKFTAGGITEVNQMTPPSAPDDQTVNPMIWGIKLTKVAANTGLFALQFNGMVSDPQQPITAPPTTLNKTSLSKNNKSFNNYDLTFAFKADFFNKFIETGFNRGYIKDIKLEDGDFITITSSPTIFTNDLGELRMKLNFASRVKGLNKIVVKNPVMIEMELILDTPIDPITNKISLIIKDIDLPSIKVSEDNFRWPFKETGVNKAKDKVAKSQPSMKGYILSKELPVPNDLMGLKLVNKAVSYDKNGFLLFHSNYE